MNDCECQKPEDGTFFHCPRYKKDDMNLRRWEMCANECPADRPCPDYTRRRYIGKWLGLRRESPVHKSGDPVARTPGVGDKISKALAAIGVTEDRVSAWIGAPCGCAERREKLNAIGQWAARVLNGKAEAAREHLRRIIGGEP